MSDDWKLALLTEAEDGTRVLDCAQRARDYILMESGREPDALWVTGYFNDIPPERTKDDIIMLGVELPDGSLSGLLGMAPGFETAEEWYIGLMLIAEVERGKGIGSAALREVIRLAKTAGAKRLKLSVFTANEAGLRFWQRNGFVYLRDAADDGPGDRHDRVVLVREI